MPFDKRFTYAVYNTGRFNLQCFSRDVCVETPLEGFHHVVHWDQRILSFQRVIELVGGDVGPDHVRADRIEGDALGRQMFAVAAHKANNATAGVY